MPKIAAIVYWVLLAIWFRSWLADWSVGQPIEPNDKLARAPVVMLFRGLFDRAHKGIKSKTREEFHG